MAASLPLVGITLPPQMLDMEPLLKKVTENPLRQLTKATEPQKKRRRLPLHQSWTTLISHLLLQLLRRHSTATELLTKSCLVMERLILLPATRLATWV